MLSLLGLAHDWQHVDILTGGTRTAEFLTLNPNGKIPTVVLDDARTLGESNAILGCLARNPANNTSRLALAWLRTVSGNTGILPVFCRR